MATINVGRHNEEELYDQILKQIHPGIKINNTLTPLEKEIFFPGWVLKNGWDCIIAQNTERLVFQSHEKVITEQELWAAREAQNGGVGHPWRPYLPPMKASGEAPHQHKQPGAKTLAPGKSCSRVIKSVLGFWVADVRKSLRKRKRDPKSYH